MKPRLACWNLQDTSLHQQSIKYTLGTEFDAKIAVESGVFPNLFSHDLIKQITY